MLATSCGMQGCARRSLCLAMAPNISASMLAGFIPATIGVTIVPGHTALQRMFWAWKRRAVWRVMPTMAAFEDTYAAPPHPITPATEATLTIEAPDCIRLEAARMQRIVPFWLVSTMRSRSSSVKRSMGLSPSSRMPALLTSTSIFPNLSITTCISFSGSSGLEISVATARTLPPFSSISLATSCRAASRRAVITTVAPSAANSLAVAAPTPELPPVITATLSFKRSILLPPV